MSSKVEAKSPIVKTISSGEVGTLHPLKRRGKSEKAQGFALRTIFERREPLVSSRSRSRCEKRLATRGKASGDDYASSALATAKESTNGYERKSK